MTRRTLARTLALLTAVAPAFLLRSPSQAQTSPAASGSASASASASSSASAFVLTLISTDPPPPEKSKAPTFKEWKEASQPIDFEGARLDNCSARRVREWVRVNCSEPLAILAIVAGPSEGFSGAITTPEVVADDSGGGWGGGSFTAKGSFNFLFPVRRGERRVFEMIKANHTSGTEVFPGDTSYITAYWLADEEPVILVQ